jgi:hypothetical protein
MRRLTGRRGTWRPWGSGPFEARLVRVLPPGDNPARLSREEAGVDELSIVP